MPLTADQLAALEKSPLTLRMLVKVIPLVGDPIRACIGSDSVPNFNGEAYPASPVSISEFEWKSGLDESNADFRTLLSEALNSLDLRGGHWQGATVELTLIDILQPEIGYIERKRGRFGLAQIQGRQVRMEYRSLTSLLNQPIGFRYSRICRDYLGGPYCTKNLTAFTFTGTVGTVTNEQKFVISTSQANDYFKYGKITFTSGANDGLSMEVAFNVGTLITLFKPMPGAVVNGDTYSIVAGCDGTLTMCHNKFNNAINHFAEDSIPETSKALKVVRV